jgi:hypothetical protein
MEAICTEEPNECSVQYMLSVRSRQAESALRQQQEAKTWDVSMAKW